MACARLHVVIPPTQPRTDRFEGPRGGAADQSPECAAASSRVSRRSAPTHPNSRKSSEGTIGKPHASKKAKLTQPAAIAAASAGPNLDVAGEPPVGINIGLRSRQAVTAPAETRRSMQVRKKTQSSI